MSKRASSRRASTGGARRRSWSSPTPSSRRTARSRRSRTSRKATRSGRWARTISRRPLVFEARALGAFDGTRPPDGRPITDGHDRLDRRRCDHFRPALEPPRRHHRRRRRDDADREGRRGRRLRRARRRRSRVGPRRAANNDAGEEILVAFMVRANTPGTGGGGHDHDGTSGRIDGTPNAETREIAASSRDRALTVRVTDGRDHHAERRARDVRRSRRRRPVPRDGLGSSRPSRSSSRRLRARRVRRLRAAERPARPRGRDDRVDERRGITFVIPLGAGGRHDRRGVRTRRRSRRTACRRTSPRSPSAIARRRAAAARGRTTAGRCSAPSSSAPRRRAGDEPRRLTTWRSSNRGGRGTLFLRDEPAPLPERRGLSCFQALTGPAAPARSSR